MFNAFSWNEFLTLMLTGVIAYYTVTTLLFFRHEIATRLRSTSRQPGASLAQEYKASPEIIGKVDSSLPPINERRSSLAESSEIFVTDPDENPETIEQAKPIGNDFIVGTISDLLEEIKTVVDQIASVNTSTDDVNALFEALLNRYTQLRSTPYQETITVFIHELAKEKLNNGLSIDQIRRWWN